MNELLNQIPSPEKLTDNFKTQIQEILDQVNDFSAVLKVLRERPLFLLAKTSEQHKAIGRIRATLIDRKQRASFSTSIQLASPAWSD